MTTNSVSLPVSGLKGSSEMIRDDRGEAIPPMRSSTSGGMTIRSSAAFAPIVAAASRRPRAGLRGRPTLCGPPSKTPRPSQVGAGPFHRGEDMGADRTIGIEDRDRALEHRLKRPPQIKPLARPADEHGDGLQVAGGLACRLGRGRAARSRPRPRRPAQAQRRRASAAARLSPRPIGPAVRRSCATASALARSACSLASVVVAAASAASAAASCSSVLRFRFSATRTGTIARAASCEAVTAASLAWFAFLAAASASAASAAATRAGTRFGSEQGRVRDLDGRDLAWRHDHPHAQPGRVEQACREVEGQPDAAVGRRMARQGPPCSAMPDQVSRCMWGM